MAPRAQLRQPPKKRNAEEKVYSQYCGLELTKEEQLIHSCQKKPKKNNAKKKIKNRRKSFMSHEKVTELLNFYAQKFLIILGIDKNHLIMRFYLPKKDLKNAVL